jgi:hypothetical protein
MALSPKDQADIEERRRIKLTSAGYYQAQQDRSAITNPTFGQNPFEPQDYIPKALPEGAEPLPSGRYIDPNIPSSLNMERMSQTGEYLTDPKKYVEDNKLNIINEQSLLDRGKSFLSRLFDYEDDADLSLFGANLSAVESTWDNTLRYVTGFYDVVGVGLGGLISAMPGGLQTLSPDDLTGGMTSKYGVGESFMKVLSGEMEPGSAPSPGQIAITSIAIEAARIKRGETRISDVLLANPATGPFIMAALAADSSPLQKKDFDILDPEQRTEAFGQGAEKWMSGITDAGLMFADPLIGVGVGAKVIRAGALGSKLTPLDKVRFSGALEAAVKKIDDAHMGGRSSKLEADLLLEQADSRTPLTLREHIQKLGESYGKPMPEDFDPTLLPKLPNGVKAGDYEGDELAKLLHRFTEFDADGNKVMSVDEISRDLGVKNMDRRADVATLLYQSRTPYEASLVLDTLAGSRAAQQRLIRLAPAVADYTFRVSQDALRMKGALAPDAYKMVEGYLSRSKENLIQQKRTIADDIAKMEADTPVDEIGRQQASETLARLQQQDGVLQQSLDELDELEQVAKGGSIDNLDPASAFYDADQAKRIIDDLVNREGFYERAGDMRLLESAIGNRFWYPSKNNMYSRAVMRSRARRGRAAFEYSVEGAGILPRVLYKGVDKKTGEAITEKTGWFSESIFETGRFRRGMRAWRWLGEETPSGYIGLKGTATVGSEREFDAAVRNLDLYKGDGVSVTVNGEDIVVGGMARMQDLKARFFSALNDPNQDSFKVLRDIENEIVEDYYNAYFGMFDSVDGKTVAGKSPARRAIDNVVLRARRVQKAYERSISEQGYWVDEAGEVHEAAFLDSQLANGAYMLPFEELEKQFRKEIKSRGSMARLHQTLATSGEYISRFDRTFQNFWRPATLLRLSYTQRNTFEGLARAAAYNASLMPFTWPITGTALGARNAVMKRVNARAIKTAEKRLAGNAEIKRSVADLDTARADKHFLDTAMPEPNKAGNMVYRVYDKNKQSRVLSEAQYESELAAANQRVANETAALDVSVKADFDKSVEGTRFGKWRQKQITAVRERIEENDRALAVYMDIGEDGLGPRWAQTIPEDELDYVAELIRADLYEHAQLTMLEYNPARALAAYRTQAGRQRRIGSGTSMGPDGNYYGDAFYGPYAQLNRDLMSADKTTQQRLQARFDAYSSLLEKVQRRSNRPIPWSGGSNSEAWSAGVASAIEEATSSWGLRRMLLNDGDVVKTMAEIETTAQGREWLRRVANLFAEDLDLSEVPVQKGVITMEQAAAVKAGKAPGEARGSSRLIPFATTMTDPISKKQITVLDRKRASIYLQEAYRRIELTTQKGVSNSAGESADALWDLLMTRAREKEVPTGRTRADGDVMAEVEVSRDAVQSALSTMPEDIKANFGSVAGTELLYLGTDSFMGTYSKIVSKLFNALGTVPEDALVRGPFYNQRFKETRNALIKSYLDDNNASDVLINGGEKALGATGQRQGLTMSHKAFAIPQNELSRIMVQSHRRALMDTREWLYTIERRTNLGKYGEYIFPFVSASQNSITVIGKLLWKEPWLAPFIADLWRAPSRLGIEDEEGNLMMPMPFTWIQDTLAKNPDIPVLGGVVANSDWITIPKDGLNVFLPDTGFGLVPRPAPIVQVSASELMKANFINQETPQLLKTSMGDSNAEEFWRLLQDWVFGEEQGMSPELLSYDRLVPAAYQKLLRSKQELSSQYGYKAMLAWTTENARYWAGERDEPPTEAEINKRATNALLFDMVGNFGLPTPNTPYPILTRPQVNNPVEILQDEYRKMVARDPINGSMMFQRLFGDWALLQANTKITRNVGGADPSSETISDIRELDGLIRSVTAEIPDTSLDVLGILVNNRNSAGEYEQSPYAWQKSTKIPGTNREWREVQSPQASEAERQRIAGWTEYRMFMDQLDAQMQNAGVESLESTAGRPYKAARDTFIANRSANPDYAGWWVDFQDRGGGNTLAAVKTLQMGVADPKFRDILLKDGKEQLLSIMDQYVAQRQNLVQILESTGKSIENDDNIMLKLAWAKMRQDWKSQDVRWAEIANRYLANDDNPENPGLMQEQREAMSELVGAENG